MKRIRQTTVEHPFGTLKAWMGSTHFLTKTLDRVSTEMSLHVLRSPVESTVSKQLLVLMMSETVCQIGLINICVPSGMRLFTQTILN